MLTQTLEDAILFLLAQPKLLSFFTSFDLVTGDGGHGGATLKLFYCDVISSCVLNYLHHQEIAMKTAHLLTLVMRDDLTALLVCDPTLRTREKASIARDNEESALGLWRITKSHPCEIMAKLFSLHGQVNLLILQSTMASFCNLSRVKGCRDYFTNNCSATMLQIIDGYLLSRIQIDEMKLSCVIACQALCCCARDESSCVTWISEGVYRILDNILRCYSQEDSVIEWVCKAICCLARDTPTNREAATSTDLCPTLVGVALAIRQGSPVETMNWACQAIGSLSFQCESTAALFGESGACSSLCCALEEFGYADPGLVKCGCWALANLAYLNTPNQQLLYKLGVDEILSSFLRIHSQAFSALREILITLRNLFFRNDCWYSGDCSAESGEGSVLPNELYRTRYPRVAKVCLIVLQTLEELERKRRSYRKSLNIDVQEMIPWLWYTVSGISSHRHGRSLLLATDLHKYFISTLRSSTNDFALRCTFLSLKYFIADLPSHHLDLASQLSLSLPHSLSRSLSSQDTINTGTELLAMAAKHRTLSALLGSSKGCPTLIKILTRHQTDKRLVEISLQAIKSLSENNFENIKRFESCGACRLIPSLMMLHQCDTFPIALLSCEILTLLSTSKQSIKKISSSNVSQCLLLAFNSHISTLPILKAICDLIFKLCTQSARPTALIQSLIGVGACEMLTNILIICLDVESTHSSSSSSNGNGGVIESSSTPSDCILACLRCISVLLEKSTCSTLFSKMGCHVLLFRIIEGHLKEDPLVASCYQILNTLLVENLLLRKQLMTKEICVPLLLSQSYGIDSISTAADLTPVLQEKIVNVSECLCLLLSNSSQNKNFLFVVRELFLQFIQCDVVSCLDHLVTIHLAFDLGESCVLSLLKVVTSLLECHDLFFPTEPLRPVLCLQSSVVFVTLAEPTQLTLQSEGETGPEAVATERHTLIGQLIERDTMRKFIELLSVYLTEDDQIIEWVLQSLSLFVQHDLRSQNAFDAHGLCEVSMRILSSSHLTAAILCHGLSLIYRLTLFNLKMKLKYLSLSCERVIMQHLQQHPQSEDLVSAGMLALSSLATGHDMLNTPVYHPLSVIYAHHHIDSKKICLAVCSVICSITKNTRDKALASVPSSNPFLSFKTQLSSVVLLSQSLVASCGKLLSSSEICRSVLIAMLNVVLLHSQEIDHRDSRVCSLELHQILIETDILKYLGYIIIRHLALEDVCLHAVSFLRLVTSFLDPTEQAPDLIDWRHYLTERQNPFASQLLLRCHGVGMSHFASMLLESYSRHKEVASMAVTALYQLSFHDKTKSYLSNARVFEQIVSLFHSDTIDDTLLIAILQLISKLCEQNPKNCRDLIECGICELLIWSLETYSSCPPLARYVCRCVHLLSSLESKAKALFFSCQSSAVLSSCLETYTANGAIAFECCSAIYSLCLDDPQNTLHFATSTVCSALVTILSQHELSEQICDADFHALSLLCPTYCQSLVQLNQISDLTKFLTSLRSRIPIIASRFAKSHRIVLWSNRVLNSVHSDDHSLELDQLPPLVPLKSTAQDTSKMILSNLATYFTTHPAIVLESMISIGNTLALDPLQFQDQGLCEKLKETMVRYSDHVPIIIACCKVISHLTAPHHTTEVTTTNLPHQLLDLLSRRYQKHASVMEWGCQAISTIARGDPRNRSSLVSHGGCEVVVGALQIGTGSGDAFVAVVLQKSIGSVSLALAACEAVHCLGIGNKLYRERLGACGAGDALVRILQKYSDSPEVASSGCKGFVTLAQDCSSNRIKLGTIGACKTIHTVLETHLSSQPAAAWGCRAVESMSRAVDGALETRFGASICTSVIRAMQMHQGDVEVASSGSGALSALTFYPSFLLPMLQHHAIEVLLFSIQLCVFDEPTIISSSSALCRLMNPNTYNVFVSLDCLSTFLCLLDKYHASPATSYPLWFNLYKLSFCSSDCCLRLLSEGLLEIALKTMQGGLLGMQGRERGEEVEEEWAATLVVMRDVLILLREKQVASLKQQVVEQQSVLESLEREMRATSGQREGQEQRRVIASVRLIVEELLFLLPPTDDGVSGQGGAGNCR
jgi:hypothetical protein